MDWLNHPYLLPLLVTAVISAALAIYAFQSWRVTAAHSLGVMMAAVSFWSLTYAAELGSVDLATKIFWWKCKYLGIQLVPISGLVFAMRYTGRGHWLTRRNLVLLSVIPALVLGLVWTGGAHGLYSQKVSLQPMGEYTALEIIHGPAFWLNVFYSYLLTLLGSAYFVWANLRRPGLKRVQVAALVGAILLPWIGNLLSVAGLNPLEHLDLTPFAFALSGLLLMLVLSEFRLLDVLPIAHISIYENLADGVAVVDTSLRVVELNPAAERILGYSTAEVTGVPLQQILPGKIPGFHPEMLDQPLNNLAGILTNQDIAVGQGEEKRYYTLSTSSFKDRKDNLTGYMIVWRDITDRKQMEEALRASEESYRQSVENSPNPIFAVDRNGLIQNWNLACEAAFLYSQEVLGKSYHLILNSPGEGQKLDALVERVFTDKVTLSDIDVAYRRQDGQERFMITRLYPLIDPEGHVKRCIFANTDITERKRADKAFHRQFEELRILHALAAASVEIKDEDELIEHVTQIVGEAFFPDNFGVLLADQKSGELFFHASYRGLPDEIKTRSIPAGKGVTGQVALSGAPRRVADVTKEPAYIRLSFHAGSEICVPIMLGERVIGVINAERSQIDAFSEADERLMATIAGQMATALDRLHSAMKEKRWTDKLAILYRASQEIVGSLDHESIYVATHRAVAQLMPLDVFLIGILEPNLESVAPAYFMDANGPLQARSIPVGQGLSGHVVANGQAVLVDDLKTFQEFKPVSIGPLRVRSLLAVPLRLGNKVLGLLSAQCYQPQVYTQEDQQVLSTLANQVAIALDNARLFAETHLRTSQLEALNNVIASVPAATAMPQLLAHAIEQLCPVLAAETGCITLWEQRAAFGLPQDLEPAFEQVIGVVRKNLPQATAIMDWQKADISEELQPLSEFMHQAGLAASITVPIQAEGANIGAITLAARAPRSWSSEEIVLVEAVGRQLGVAAERLGLLENIQSRLREVTLLSNVISLTASAKDLTAALQKICREVGGYFKSPQVGVAFLQPGGEYAEVIAENSSQDRPSAIGTLIPVKNNPSMAYILEHKTPLPVSDAQHDPLLAPVHELMRQRQVASILLVPILIGDEVVGTLGVDQLEPFDFSQTDIDLMQNIARQVAQALERLRLFTSTEEFAGRLEQLAELSGYLNQPFTVSEVLEGVGKGALSLGSADRAALYVRQPGDTVSCPWYSGLSDGYINQVTRRAREMPGGQLLQSVEPVLISDVELLPESAPVRALAKAEGFRAVGLWPMIYEGQVVASAGCYYDQPHLWVESEKKVMLAFARQAAVALQNAYLFEETRRRAQHVEALNEVISAVVATTDMSALIETVMDVMMEALRVERGAIWVESCQAARNLSGGASEALSNKLRQISPDSGEILVISDWEARQDGGANAPLGQFLSAQGLRAVLFVPVISSGERIGGILLLESAARSWLEEDIALAEAVAGQLSSALERLDLLAKIQQQAHQMQQLMDTVPEGVVLLDRDQRALLVNPAARQHLAELLDDDTVASQGQDGRITHLGGKPIEAIFSRAEKWLDIVSQGSPRRIYEVAAQSLAEGDHRGGWVLVLRDVTQERDSQLRIQMQERLATVGQLAAGIAHDFNNIMAAIVVYTDLLLIEPNLSQSSQERLSIIQKQVQRASSLIRQILDFSRRSVMEHSTLELLPFVKELDKMLGRVLPETIRLELTYQPGSYVVNADPTRLQQAFMNLALNARDAMPQGGVLHFGLDHLYLKSSDPSPLPDLAPGHWVRIEVSDTGHGIAPEIMPHIFEPFFTTKPVGQGTGLGLAQVYGIIKQHGGSIDVSSHAGKGATFTIYLEALDLAHEDGVFPAPAGNAFLGFGETVLLVEDDRSTRDAIQTLLQAQNYHTIIASNGLEAKKLFDQVGRAISLVITDMVMPGMGGVELYHALKQCDPDVKVLFITGHPLDQERHALLEEGQVQWMQKPFSLQELSSTVRRILDEV